MNKDVIYIEPEDDITDILANVKSAKNKIVALVPPKKAGVLRSAVNFKLIAKAARQKGKIVVLITTDASLLRLAESVKMPTARSLQSKPKLPADLDVSEFGADEKEPDGSGGEVGENADGNDEGQEETAPDDDVIEEEPKKNAKKKDSPDEKDAAKSAAVAAKGADIELGDDDLDGDDKKTDKKKANKNIPDFKKVRTPIIIATIVLVLIIGFSFWAFNIAPAAKINVKISTSSQNFSENVSFVTEEAKAKPEEGIFYLQQKSITKTAEAEFAATGEVDKGSKATGTISITRPAGSVINDKNDLTFSVPQGTTFTCNGVSFRTSQGASANATEADLKRTGGTIFDPVYTLEKDIISGQIQVVAAENGDKYNLAAGCTGWSSSLSTDKKYNVTNTAMTGGSSKKVKIVSQKDVEAAEAGLAGQGESEAREKLASEFSNTFLLIENSFSAADGKLSSSPAINEEVKDGVKPKVIKEIKYSIYAVERDDINKFIRAKTNAGDDTQTIYSTGLADQASDEDKGRIESFKKDKDTYTGKLKTVVKTGPEVTEEMISKKSLGKKIGEVQSQLKSIKGISEVKIDTSYFWVMAIPDDPNKVSFNIVVE